MRRARAGHRLNAMAVVFDFAQEEFAIQRRAMTMCVQLNVGAGGGKSPNVCAKTESSVSPMYGATL